MNQEEKEDRSRIEKCSVIMGCIVHAYYSSPEFMPMFSTEIRLIELKHQIPNTGHWIVMNSCMLNRFSLVRSTDWSDQEREFRMLYHFHTTRFKVAKGRFVIIGPPNIKQELTTNNRLLFDYNCIILWWWRTKAGFWNICNFANEFKEILRS